MFTNWQQLVIYDHFQPDTLVYHTFYHMCMRKSSFGWFWTLNRWNINRRYFEKRCWWTKRHSLKVLISLFKVIQGTIHSCIFIHSMPFHSIPFEPLYQKSASDTFVDFFQGLFSEATKNPSFCQVMTQVNSGGGMAEERLGDRWAMNKRPGPLVVDRGFVGDEIWGLFHEPWNKNPD